MTSHLENLPIHRAIEAIETALIDALRGRGVKVQVVGESGEPFFDNVPGRRIYIRELARDIERGLS